MRLRATPFLAFLLLLALGTTFAPHMARSSSALASTGPYAGWAMEAYPGDSVATLRAEMARQLTAGADIIWIGQNNPGEVDQRKSEPALSYAVWAAYMDPQSPQHADGAAMFQAQMHALEAARSLGARVVLPVGYQIQMGAAWNAAHPGELRVDTQGHVYNEGGESASFYAPDYRRDIVAYYRWMDAHVIRPYASTILMLDLADEPADGDYSTWAAQAFRAQYGFNLRSAGNNAARQEEVGRFEADYVADYAAWSAGQWATIDPSVRVTMSFDGGWSRYKHEGPDLEQIFREAPANFTVTFDAYPRDGLYNTALRQGDLVSLFTLVRTLAHYATVYNRPLWLWSTGNSWGLNGSSPDPGNIADAVANAVYLAQSANQGGGALQGIAVWNYNIKGQGLYNDTHHLTYVPDQMFQRVSAVFPLLRTIMAAPLTVPTTAVSAPNAPILRQAGATLAMRAVDPYDWTALAALARDDVPAPTLTQLDGDPLTPTLQTTIVLARSVGDLAPADRTALIAQLARGGTVIAASSLISALAAPGASLRTVAHAPAAGNAVATRVQRVSTAHGTLLTVTGEPVEDVFADRAAPWAGTLWTQLFHSSVRTQGYLVTAGGVTLFYGGIDSPGALMPVPANAHGTLTAYDTYGVPLRTLTLPMSGTPVELPVGRRAYALLVPTEDGAPNT